MFPKFTDAVADAVTTTACALLAIGDQGTSWLNSIRGVDGDFANIAGALRRNICNESSPDTSGYGPVSPFTGGQCSFLYNIAVFFERDTGAGAGSVAFFDVPGPVESVTQVANETRFQARVIANNGAYNQVRFGSFGGPYVITDIDVDPDGGQSDTCGDPPGVVQEYNDFSQTVSITYEDNSQTEITEDIDVTLGPLIVGIGGVVYAPVTVETPDFTFNGNLEVAPTLKVELFPDGLFGGGGSTDKTPPNPDVDDPEPTVINERRRIIGAIVTVTDYDESIAQVTQVAQGETPDIFVPRVGNVSFYIDTAGGQAWTEPKPLKNVREYVPCPAREGAVDVAVTAGTGFTLDVTPVYAELGLT